VLLLIVTAAVCAWKQNKARSATAQRRRAYRVRFGVYLLRLIQGNRLRMKIAIFNVNRVNGRLPMLLRRLAEAEPADMRQDRFPLTGAQGSQQSSNELKRARPEARWRGKWRIKQLTETA
jgi:hypothetical protein